MQNEFKITIVLLYKILMLQAVTEFLKFTNGTLLGSWTDKFVKTRTRLIWLTI